MTTGGSNSSNWKFDPKTGERIPQEPTEGNQDMFRTSPPPSQEQGSYQPQQPTQPYNYEPQQPTQPNPSYPQQYSTPTPTPTPAPAKKRSGAPLVIGGIALVLIAALVGGGFFLWQNVVNRPAVSVERLLPANTLGYFSFDPVLEGSQKAAMDKLREAFEAQPGFKEAWDKLTNQATSSLTGGLADIATPDTNNIDNLATYLGNSVTLAVLAPGSDDLQRLEDATQSGDISTVAGDVMGKNVVGIVDLDFNPLNKKGPISDLKQQVDNVGKAELVEKYRDVEIRKFITNTQEIYFALLDGSSTAVVGAQAAPLKVLIDGFRDNKTLKDDATFKSLSGQVPQDRIAGLYVNLTEIYKQAQLISPEIFQDQQLQNLSGAMLLTVSAANDGMQIDVASETDLSLMDTQVQINPDARPDPSTINDVPSDALTFYAGTDLKTTLSNALKNLRANSQTGDQVNEQIKSFEDTLGISLENDLIPLLGGDFLVSVSTTGSGDNLTPRIVFELKLTDTQKTKDLIEKVLSNPDANAEKFQIGNDTFYGDQNSGVLLGVTNDRFWFVFSPGGSEPAQILQPLIDNLGKGFGTSAQWNGAKTHLVRDSNAIAFIDLNNLRTMLEGQMVGAAIDQREYDTNVAPFVKPLKYFLLGSATQAAKNGTLSRNHTVLFLGISK